MATATVSTPQARTYVRTPPAADLLAAGEVFGLSMFLLAADALGGSEGLSAYDPETIREEIQLVHRVAVSDDNADRLYAALAVATTDRFWNEAHAFIKIANVLAGSGFTAVVEDPADVLESSWALTEAFLIEPPGTPLSAEVLAYLEHTCHEQGFAVVPRALARFGVLGRPQDLAAWSDRQEVAQAARQKALAVDETVLLELHALFDQVATLPLKHANAAEAAKGLRAMLGSPS